MSALVLLLALLAGLAVRAMGYPPLIGYLVAGFLCSSLGFGSLEQLKPLADFGITMLLFTIGLKLRLSVLKKPYIFGTAVLQLLIVVPLTAALIMLVGMFYTPLGTQSWLAPWTLAFALSFSSTVFAIKIFDERGENNSFHAAIAVGVLVIQDVLAVAYLVLASGDIPSPWVALLLLLPFTRQWWKPLVSRVLAFAGHGELQLLFGIVIAVCAYELFELFQLKGGLGALVVGAIIGYADAPRSTELYNRLVNLKNLFLIAFFLQIGYYGIPEFSMLLVALVLVLLLVLRPVIYFALFTLMRLRSRTAVLAGASLSTYSEFGLIVAAFAANEGLLGSDWLVTLALAIAMTFIVATPVNKSIHTFYRKYSPRLKPYEKERLPEEEIEQLGDSDIVVLGMGRVGHGAYQYLVQNYGERVIGVEESYTRAVELRDKEVKCVHGDASDRDFWDQTNLHNREMVLVSLSNHRENLHVINMARELGCTCTLAATARFEDERKQLEEMGCIAFNVYADVGWGFAEHVDAVIHLDDGGSRRPLDAGS